GSHLRVMGPKGTLELDLMPGIEAAQNDSVLTLTKAAETPETLKTYGLMRTLVDNMVTGVSKGFERKLEINGVGYRAALQGNALQLSLGFSHPVLFQLPQGVEAKVEKNVISLTGS